MLPEGSPAVDSWTLSGALLYTVELAVSGEPGATVTASVSGAERARAELDDSGHAVLTVSSNVVEMFFGRTLDLRYIAGDEIGPATSLPLRDLFA